MNGLKFGALIPTSSRYSSSPDVIQALRNAIPPESGDVMEIRTFRPSHGSEMPDVTYLATEEEGRVFKWFHQALDNAVKNHDKEQVQGLREAALEYFRRLNMESIQESLNRNKTSKIVVSECTANPDAFDTKQANWLTDIKHI